ncbi:MAG: hypothetical protein ACOX02_04365 [Acholeplasmatales bacterium]
MRSFYVIYDVLIADTSADAECKVVDFYKDSFYLVSNVYEIGGVL